MRQLNLLHLRYSSSASVEGSYLYKNNNIWTLACMLSFCFWRFVNSCSTVLNNHFWLIMLWTVVEFRLIFSILKACFQLRGCSVGPTNTELQSSRVIVTLLNFESLNAISSNFFNVIQSLVSKYILTHNFFLFVVLPAKLCSIFFTLFVICNLYAFVTSLSSFSIVVWSGFVPSKASFCKLRAHHPFWKDFCSS